MNDPVEEAIRCANAYRSARKAAEGRVAGKAIYNLRHDEKALRAALWEARDIIEEELRKRIGAPHRQP